MLLGKRRLPARQEQTEQNIRRALELIRPILRIEECALSLDKFETESGTVILTAKGTCSQCELSVSTFIAGIEAQLKLRVPEVTSVRFA